MPYTLSHEATSQETTTVSIKHYCLRHFRLRASFEQLPGIDPVKRHEGRQNQYMHPARGISSWIREQGRRQGDTKLVRSIYKNA